MLFRIGDFAKMSRVSVKTLHHYDEIGLLKPTEVNAATGYRFYALDQLPRLNRILVLKDLGFSLDQIRMVLCENLSPVELRGMLRLKQATLQEMITEGQARLERVKARLKLIEQEDTRLHYDIVVKPVASVVIASARAVMPSSGETFHRCEQLAHEVSLQLVQAGLKSSGPWLAIYHDAPALSQDQTIDVEMGIAIEQSWSDSLSQGKGERASLRELTGAPAMACLLHRGDYDGLWDAYIAMMTWVATSGYQSAGPYRCLYLRLPLEGQPLTEMQLPIERNIEEC